MKVAVAVLTYNHILSGRQDLFAQTLDSLRATEHPFDLFVVDNGSGDGTQDVVAAMGGYCYQGTNTTCGHGTNLAARVAIGSGADLCVLSDDDMLWHEGWLETLTAWWSQAPSTYWLTGCHLEPEFPWNTIRGTAFFGGVRALVRASTGAASWSFRAADWPKIGPIPEKRQGVGDVPACERVWNDGGRIAQLDLADHAGKGMSSWGNRTEELYGWELEPVREWITKGRAS